MTSFLPTLIADGGFDGPSVTDFGPPFIAVLIPVLLAAAVITAALIAVIVRLVRSK